MKYSFIIPVYNRPQEIRELLESILRLEGDIPFEVVIIEDGSNLRSEQIINRFIPALNISYLYKDNTGPGDSRNYGMERAGGDYFLILDSDCILPENYLKNVDSQLNTYYTDCFGGPDKAHPSFSKFQKGINFAMTSFFSTGGIRGNKKARKNFQPRSFNMGLSKKAFKASGGFGNIHPGEDPDLVLRLHKRGFKSQLIDEAYVYHKRRISWAKYASQVYKFGKVRPILNHWHPRSSKVVFWLPSIFLLGLLAALLLTLFGIPWVLYLYGFYFILIFITALLVERDWVISFYSVIAVFIQLICYGCGFLISYILLTFSGKEPKTLFPGLFFENAKKL